MLLICLRLACNAPINSSSLQLLLYSSHLFSCLFYDRLDDSAAKRYLCPRTQCDNKIREPCPAAKWVESVAWLYVRESVCLYVRVRMRTPLPWQRPMQVSSSVKEAFWHRRSLHTCGNTSRMITHCVKDYSAQSHTHTCRLWSAFCQCPWASEQRGCLRTSGKQHQHRVLNHFQNHYFHRLPSEHVMMTIELLLPNTFGLSCCSNTFFNNHLHKFWKDLLVPTETRGRSKRKWDTGPEDQRLKPFGF